MESAVKMVKEIPIKSRVQILTDNAYVKKTVCAYARVSTDKDEQEDSFERQIAHYTEYIRSRHDWEFGGIYADEGISGTKAEKRPQFMKMIADCREKKIDKILVKSVSRFARNTVDALTFIRELRELGVSILFESENIDTMTPNGEVLLTILAAMAEQESRNISKNIKWAMQKKFKNGDMMYNYAQTLGYTKSEKGILIIEPEEAKIVIRIYREFICGYSTTQIAERLERDKIKSPQNKDKWYPSCVRSMLSNEKYKGSALMGKTFKPDVLSKKRYKNEGQEAQYYVEDNHPSIISKEMFELVQAEIERRSNLRSSTKSGVGKFSSKYPFSGYIVCGECGSKFRRYSQTNSGAKIPTWVCVNHKINGNTACVNLQVKEKDIERVYLETMAEIMKNKEELETKLLINIEEVLDDSLAEKLETIEKEIIILQAEIMECNKRKRNGEIGNEEYYTTVASLGNKIDSLENEKRSLESKGEGIKLAKYRMEEIATLLDNTDMTKEFNPDIFKSLVEIVKVHKGKQIEIIFKCGVSVIKSI